MVHLLIKKSALKKSPNYVRKKFESVNESILLLAYIQIVFLQQMYPGTECLFFCHLLLHFVEQMVLCFLIQN